MGLKEDILEYLGHPLVSEVNTETVCKNFFEEYNHKNHKLISEKLFDLHKEGEVNYENRHPDTKYLQKGSWYYWWAKDSLDANPNRK